MAEEKYAFVTGGSRGIGRAIVLGLAEAGWNVAINYRSNEAAAREVLSRVESTGRVGVLAQGDIGDCSVHAAMLDTVHNAFPRIDCLVNNAGMAPRERRDVLDMSAESYDEVMATNLKGPVFLTQAVAKGMLASESVIRRTIVTIGSISAYTSSTNRAEYCVSKAGLAMMTQVFADRLAGAGIGVFEIRPGIIKTDMNAAVHEKYEGLVREGLTPMPRLGQPEDVAAAAVAVAEGRFPFSTGEVINVDGGFHMHRL